jgi:hypothetical protein
MKRTTKLGVIVAALVVVIVLVYAAVSDNMFFVTQKLNRDDVVYQEGDRYALYFYKDGKKLEVVEISYAINKSGNNLAAITFQISNKIDYKLDSLALRFEMLQLPSALVLENMDSYSPPPLINIPDDSSSIEFSFSGPEVSQGSLFETLYLDFSLDMSGLDPFFSDKLILVIGFSLHEQSIFKILRYTDQVSVQLYIPFNTQ